MNVRLIFFISFFIFIECLSCSNNKDENNKQTGSESKPYAQLEFREKIVDFGTVKKGDVLNAVYNFKNVSDTKLIIEYVNPDCICTDYSVSKTKIPSGDSAQIKLTLDTKEKIGNQKIFAVVKANTKTRFYRLLLKAKVE